MRSDAWPLREGETAVRCVPAGFDCNEEDGNPRFATTEYDGTTLSAPAFEIRWRSEDLAESGEDIPWPGELTTETTPTLVSIESTESIETVSSTKSATNTSTPPTTTASTPPESSAASPGSSPPMTIGSIAGVAIGASVGTLLAALLTIWIIRHRQRQKPTQTSEDRTSENNGPTATIAEADSNQPPMELHPEPIGPRELESAPVSPESGEFPRLLEVISLNEVPVEMAAEPVDRGDSGVGRGNAEKMAPESLEDTQGDSQGRAS